MRVSEKGKQMVRTFEGLQLTAYKCPAGKWTIGYGHTGKVHGKKIRKGLTITRDEAEDLLDGDLLSCERTIRRQVKVKLSQGQLDALADFVFNLGSGNLYISTLRKKLNRKEYSGASKEFPKWNKCKGKPLSGLTRRRTAEQALFLSE